MSDNLKATRASAYMGEQWSLSGGVFDHGTREEDGPVTWETLVVPRRNPAMRRAGPKSPTLGTSAERTCPAAKNKRPHRGRSQARGTGAVADGDEGVGGLHRSVDVGEPGSAGTRPSKGGPC